MELSSSGPWAWWGQRGGDRPWGTIWQPSQNAQAARALDVAAGRGQLSLSVPSPCCPVALCPLPKLLRFCPTLPRPATALRPCRWCPVTSVLARIPWAV